MPVVRRDEPRDFDAKVRRPGLQWLHEKLGGERAPRAGAPVKPLAPGERLTATGLKDYWTACLPDLRSLYKVCSYAGLKIREGGDSVDHFECKESCVDDAARHGLIYEWRNYRYAFLNVNRYKGTRQVLDPFEVAADWFALEFVGLTVRPRDHLREPMLGRVRDTIKFAGLNEPWLVRLRSEYFDAWSAGQIHGTWLRECAPFIAAEIERQGITPDVAPC